MSLHCVVYGDIRDILQRVLLLMAWTHNDLCKLTNYSHLPLNNKFTELMKFKIFLMTSYRYDLAESITEYNIFTTGSLSDSMSVLGYLNKPLNIKLALLTNTLLSSWSSADTLDPSIGYLSIE